MAVATIDISMLTLKMVTAIFNILPATKNNATVNFNIPIAAFNLFIAVIKIPVLMINTAFGWFDIALEKLLNFSVNKRSFWFRWCVL